MPVDGMTIARSASGSKCPPCTQTAGAPFVSTSTPSVAAVLVDTTASGGGPNEGPDTVYAAGVSGQAPPGPPPWQMQTVPEGARHPRATQFIRKVNDTAEGDPDAGSPPKRTKTIIEVPACVVATTSASLWVLPG